jgi:hypothetical protein
MTLETASASFHHLLLGESGKEAGGGPAFLVSGRRKGRPNQLDAGQTQFSEQQVNARGVDLVGRFHAASPRVATISS